MTDRTYTAALIVGSVSEPSLNRRLANALVGLSTDAGLKLVEVDIGHLPFFGSAVRVRAMTVLSALGFAGSDRSGASTSSPSSPRRSGANPA